MRAVLTMALALIFSANINASEFVCTAPDGKAFPEQEIKITLSETGEDTFETEGDDPIIRKHMKEDRLRWKFGFFGFDMVIDARKERLEVYDEDGIFEEAYPLNCAKAKEAEQEMIARMLHDGKMKAHGSGYEKVISDVPRDSLDFELPMFQERSFNQGIGVSK